MANMTMLDATLMTFIVDRDNPAKYQDKLQTAFGLTTVQFIQMFHPTNTISAVGAMIERLREDGQADLEDLITIHQLETEPSPA